MDTPWVLTTQMLQGLQTLSGSSFTTPVGWVGSVLLAPDTCASP